MNSLTEYSIPPYSQQIYSKTLGLLETTDRRELYIYYAFSYTHWAHSIPYVDSGSPHESVTLFFLWGEGLPWVFVAAHRFSLVAANGGRSSAAVAALAGEHGI